MHHVFELDEILRLIASDLIDTGDGGALSLACCCRSFSTPVLDTMWEEGQSDFTTLLKTFPCSVWRVVNMTFRFTRQPSEEEWAQFSLYARRMRKLFIFPHETVFPSPVGFRLLSAHFSGSCMLPNLRELDWCNTRADTGIALIFPSLVSPFLENLHYELRDISHTRTVLSALTPAYSSLQYIYFTRSDPGLVQEFSTLLLKCNPNQLHFFSAGSPLSRTAFLHASQLPDLQYFDTPAIQADGLEPLGDASLPTAMFSSLQYLYMRGLDTGSIWLRSLTRLCFENLLMLVLELKNAAAARTCLPLTLKYLRYQTLTELVIRCEDDLSGFEVDGAIIEHLLPLKQLTRLELSFICYRDKCGHKLSGEDLEKLVKAMPKLKGLILGCNLCSRPANDSIKSLVAIAKHCEHLEKLVIHTDVEAIVAGLPDRDDFSGEDLILGDPTPVGCPLRCATFGPCSIPNGEQGVKIFASMLLRMFPHLVSVSSHHDVPQWKSVEKIIPILRRACVTPTRLTRM